MGFDRKDEFIIYNIQLLQVLLLRLLCEVFDLAEKIQHKFQIVSKVLNLVAAYTTLLQSSDVIYKQVLKMLTELNGKYLKKYLPSANQKQVK